MDSTIAAALIGGVFVVIASIGAVLFARKLDKDKSYAHHDRREVLEGNWVGTAHQEGSTTLEYSLTVKLIVVSQSIRGEGTVRLENQNQEHIDYAEIIGSFEHDRFLKAEYKTKRLPGAIQFGFIILELTPDGRKLSGGFISFGAMTQNLGWGTIELQKTA